MSDEGRVDSFLGKPSTDSSAPEKDSDAVEKTGSKSGGEGTPQVSWLSRWLIRRSRTPTRSEDEDFDDFAPLTTSLDTCPDGYPKVAMFQASDRNFLQYPEQLEEELEELDRVDHEKSPAKLKNKARDDRQCQVDLENGMYPAHLTRTRPTVTSHLKAKLLEYDDFLLKCKEMRALQKPSKRDYGSVRKWFRDENPIVRREAQFIRRREDIITLRPGRECAGFDGFVERSVGETDKFFQKWLRWKVVQYLFLTPELREKSKDSHAHYYSPERIEALVNILIAGVIFVLLVLPVVIMYKITSISARQTALDAIGVLIVFTLIFAMAISALTTARRQELFGASAAYCAVLVVFISNFGVQQVEILPQS